MPDILIADDHPLFRDALQRAVLTALPQARVHGADSVHTLLGLIEQFPDAELLLLDLHMPGARGYSALAVPRVADHRGVRSRRGAGGAPRAGAWRLGVHSEI